MGSVTFEVRLDDEDGMVNILNMVSSFLNNNRIRGAKQRNGIEPVEEQEEKQQEENSELDSAGVAWDPDKHSSKRTKLADGTWRPKRGTKSQEEKPVPPPPPGSAALAPEEISYKEMMDRLKGKGLSLEQMNELANQVGVGSIGLLISSPDLIPAVLALAEGK
jgi:hypothetical protein